MAAAVLSYDHGTSTTKLIGDTLGVFFDQTVMRHRDREALVVRHQGVQGRSRAQGVWVRHSSFSGVVRRYWRKGWKSLGSA